LQRLNLLDLAGQIDTGRRFGVRQAEPADQPDRRLERRDPIVSHSLQHRDDLPQAWGA